MTIAQVSGKWYVVKSEVRLGMVVTVLVSKSYDTSEQARARLFDMIFGRVS